MTLRTIVAGVDLSVQSDHALERAAGLALMHRAKLVLVHANADDAPIEHTDNEVLKQLGEVTAAMRVEITRRLADRIIALRGRGVDVELSSPEGPPGEIVTQVARDRGADLIVVGTHGNTGISRLLLGSVATAVLRLAPCDVLVCRGQDTGAFRRPLVATDFSPTAALALLHAAEITEADAPIELVHAWQLPAGSWGASLLGQTRFPWSTVRDGVLQAAKLQADKLIAANGSLGHPLRVELVQGPPATVVTHTAERNAYDLIALGTHGHRGFRRLLLGSVCESTIRHAPCSVLVAHAEKAG
jgi:nucleotide-binding universal stress UspA family protein